MTAGRWNGARRRTRILVTGADAQTRSRIERAFHDVLLTEHEVGMPASVWLGRPDGLEP
ncbi:hypothetical protein ACTQ49_04345 [Luteococcus sp. Sow4_B9]|uniref:hypothetical protein n=1 Tax=Luteococcus sp. Sow4_B9 TaxID=3438792 RepID=UPI003F989C9B